MDREGIMIIIMFICAVMLASWMYYEYLQPSELLGIEYSNGTILKINPTPIPTFIPEYFVYKNGTRIDYDFNNCYEINKDNSDLVLRLYCPNETGMRP
jgi:hypothetical protein